MNTKLPQISLILTTIIASSCGTERVIVSSQPSGCSIVEQALVCSDGSSFDLTQLFGAPGSNGQNGQDGANGTDGRDGSSCSVVDTEKGVLITCSDGTSAELFDGYVITCEDDGKKCQCKGLDNDHGNDSCDREGAE